MMFIQPKTLLCVFSLASAIFVSPFHNCATTKQSTTPISKITYNSTGGRAGSGENLEISPDSVFYVQSRRGAEQTIKEKTPTQFWNDMTAKFNLQDFYKVKSDPGHALYDGIDITITVETGKEKHSLVNGNEDTVNYGRIAPFTDLLEKKLDELRVKISW